MEIDFDGGTPAAFTGLADWTYPWDTVAYPGAKDRVEITVTGTDSEGNVGFNTGTVDVRPKIDSISLSSSLRGETLEIYGYNFNDSLDNFNVVFTEGAGTVNATAPVVGTAGPTGESITIDTPDTATSGDIYVEEGTVIIASNSVFLDVWEDTAIAGSGGTAEQNLFFTAADTAYQAMRNGKSLDFSASGGEAANIEPGSGGTTYGFSPSLAVNETTGAIYLGYMYKDSGDVRPRIAISTDSGSSFGTIGFINPGAVAVASLDCQ